jgi:hypothetical protein
MTKVEHYNNNYMIIDRIAYQTNIAEQYSKYKPSKLVVQAFLVEALLLNDESTLWGLTQQERLKLASKAYLVGKKETGNGRTGIGKSMNNHVGMKFYPRTCKYFTWYATQGRQRNAKFDNPYYSYLHYIERKLFGKGDWLRIAYSKYHINKTIQEFKAIT